MKKGKTSKLQGFKTIKVTYGTTDSFELKSIYLNIQSWVQPKQEQDNWNRTILNFSRSIKHTIFQVINKDIFSENFISDLDLRSSGIVVGKKSFLNLEINLYLNEKNLDFKSQIIKDNIKELTKNILQHNFNRNEHFRFFLTKKDKKTHTE